MLFSSPTICPTCEWYDPVSICPWCGERKALASFQQVFWKYHWLILGSALILIKTCDIQAGLFTILLIVISLMAILTALQFLLRSPDTLARHYRHLCACLLRLEQGSSEGYIPADAVAVQRQAWRETREKTLEIEYLIWANKLHLSVLRRHLPKGLYDEGVEIKQKLRSHSPNNQVLDLLEEQIACIYAHQTPTHD